MNLTLFKDKGTSLNHRELDDNFLAILEAIREAEATQDIVIGSTMTKGSSRRSIHNTVKMIGTRLQGSVGINYTYAKDTGKLYRKASYSGAHEVDEQGNALEYYNTGSSGGTTVTPDGKYLIGIHAPHYLHITDIATGETGEYDISTWWEDTNMNDASTILIKDDYLYIPGYSSSLHYMLKIFIDSFIGVLIPSDRIVVSPQDQRTYYNASGDGKIAMSCAGDNNWIFNSEDSIITTVVTPSTSNIGRELAHLPIGFDSDGKAHFIRMDWNNGSVADIHNIYVQNNSGGVSPVAPCCCIRCSKK